MPQAVRIALLVALVAGALTGFALGLRAFLRSLPLPDFTFLIAGTDLAGANGQRADAIVTGWVRPDGTVALLSIPRDILAQIPGAGQARINYAFTLGGIDLLRRTVEAFLGVRLDQTAVIDLSVLERAVDALGGVELEVRERMFYEDRAGGLIIDLHPGRQVLSGSQLAGFVRYRSTPAGDLDRIDRQKRAVAAILNRALGGSSPVELSRLLQIAAEVPGDLDAILLSRWADRWRSGLAWNWLTLDSHPVEEGAAQDGPAYQTASREAIAAAVEATFGELPPLDPPHPARALVLDATGAGGAAAPGGRVAERLERLGWRVEVRAAPGTATSLVEATRAALRPGRVAASLLAIPQVNQVRSAGPGFDLRITVGQDQAGPRPRATVLGVPGEALALAARLAAQGWEVDPWFDLEPRPGKISFRPGAIGAVARIAWLLPRVQIELDHRLGTDLVISLPQ